MRWPGGRHPARRTTPRPGAEPRRQLVCQRLRHRDDTPAARSQTRCSRRSSRASFARTPQQVGLAEQRPAFPRPPSPRRRGIRRPPAGAAASGICSSHDARPRSRVSTTASSRLRGHARPRSAETAARRAWRCRPARHAVDLQVRQSAAGRRTRRDRARIRALSGLTTSVTCGRAAPARGRSPSSALRSRVRWGSACRRNTGRSRAHSTRRARARS